MQFFKAFYPSLQKVVLAMRAMDKGEAEPDEELISSVTDLVLDIDKIARDRLFICTIAAERGWKTAGKVAFRKKGSCNISCK